ncbi:hypothetical protein [Myxococcus sp. RHSTA-1-4]|uniref:hypothetical protein n=1 Tax=Myxococcus sp. RHSTA-1-4 TaxID=2874601 RepID=UPI001CBBB26B|nr:hypothetical protein [Myxococcus sp. RHSTA-1-4]MBZ4416807.1 hypothetical protein [Myxococcus sp. RHSTA-1-4]
MHLFAARSPFTEERELLPQSSTELMAGAEHALTDTPRLGAWYVHRNLDTTVEDMSTDGGLSYQVVSLSVAVFNLFNFQAVTRVDEAYTLEAFLPIEGGTPEDLPSGSSDENVNFRTPIQRQPPRQLRIGIRYGF